MRKQPYPVAQITGGLDVSVDPAFLTDKASPNLQNIYIHKGLIKKGRGWANFSANSVNETVMWMDSFPMASGISHALFATPSEAYRYNLSNDTFIAHNANFSGNDTDGFCGAPAITSTGNEVYLLTNGLDPIKSWDGNAASNFVNFANVANGWGPSGANIRAGELIYYRSRLVAGNITVGGTTNPRRVQWSISGNIANTTGTGSGYVELAETSDWITAFAIMKDKLFVIKERSIWELQYVGGTTVFTPVIRVEGVGSYASSSVIVLDEEMILYGSDNVYLFDGFTMKPVGGQIYPLLYEAESRIINAAQAGKAAAAYIEELKVYMISLVHKDKNIPDVVFRYDFDYDAWTLERKEITAIGYFDIQEYTAWSDLTVTWENLDWVWKDRDLPPGAPTTLIGDSTGAVYEDDRLTTSTDSMWWESKDFIFEHAVRWMECRVLAKEGPFRLSYSMDSGATWSTPREFANQSDWTEFVHHFNVTSRKMRFKIESEAPELEIKWIEPWYIPRTKSKLLTTS